jgi:hypothetical protein
MKPSTIGTQHSFTEQAQLGLKVQALIVSKVSSNDYRKFFTI